MSAITLLATDSDTNSGGTNTRPVSVTPAVDDLLVVVVGSSGVSGSFYPAVTCDNGITFTRVTPGAVPRVDVWISDQKVSSAVLHTVTVDFTGDPTTGQNIDVLAVSGMTRVGAAAIRPGQILNQDNATSGTTPQIVLPAACLTGNSVLFIVRAALADPFSTPPAGWTELSDNGFDTPTVAMACSAINSGFTSNTITAGASVAASYAALAIEFDASAPTPPAFHQEVDMLETVYAVGDADQEVDLKAWDIATGAPNTSITNATSGLTLAYTRLGAAPVTASGGTIVAVTTSGAHADWGIVHKSGGVYRVCLPDAAGAAPAVGRYLVTAYGVTGVSFSSAIVELTASNPRAAALTKEEIAVEALLTLAYARGHRVYESNVSGVLTPGGGYVTVTDTDGTTILSTQPMVRSAAGVLGAVNAGG